MFVWIGLYFLFYIHTYIDTYIYIYIYFLIFLIYICRSICFYIYTWRRPYIYWHSYNDIGFVLYKYVMLTMFFFMHCVWYYIVISCRTIDFHLVLFDWECVTSFLSDVVSSGVGCLRARIHWYISHPILLFQHFTVMYVF